MVVKGLDFDYVGLVGIFDVDMILSKMDFWVFECGFQLMSQVVGRVGRRNKWGKVIIQIGNSDYWVIQKVIEYNYKDFVVNEIVERCNYFYLLFYCLIEFMLKYKDCDLVNEVVDYFGKLLCEVFYEWVIGFEFLLIVRIQNYYLKEI